jgi:hypothetical protein
MPKSSNKEESKAVIDIEVSETVEVLFSAVTVISSIPPLCLSSSSSEKDFREIIILFSFLEKRKRIGRK